LLAKLILEIRQHSARDLRDQDSRIDASQSAFELCVLLAHFAEVGGDLFDQHDVETRVALGTFKNSDERLRR
jgi:hypothetical protein